MKRRDFMKVAGVTVAALGTNGVAAGILKGKKKQTGIQLFSIPQLVANDFKGTLKKLSEIGYREIEFFGPYPFSAEETIKGWSGFATQLGISKNAFYGLEVSEVKKIMKDLGLTSPSVHCDLATMRKNLKPAMDAFSSLGVKYVALPSVDPSERKGPDDYKRLIDEFNTIGAKMKEFGIRFAYHNHGFEHAKTADGSCLMDMLLQGTDRDAVVFELDVFWMKAAGANPVEYLQKNRGRYKMLHLKDASEEVRFSGDGSTPDQWIPLFPKMADPGEGVFDLAKIIQVAIESGVDHFYLERDLTPQPDKTLSTGYSFISKTLG